MLRVVYAIIIFLVLLLFVAVPNKALSGEMTSMKNKPSWLSDVDGWRPASDPSPYNTHTIFQYMNGAAELYLAYNFRELKTVRFEKTGKSAIIVEVYEMASPEDAYGVFTFEQQDPEAGIGQGSEFGGGLLRFWKGRYFVTIFGEEPSQEIEGTILVLGRRIAHSIVEIGYPPKIMGYLPDKVLTFSKKEAWFFRSHIHLNQRFFVARANILALTRDTDAVLARYETKEGKIYILLIRYPSPDMANIAFSSFKSTYMPDAGNADSVKTENGKWTSAARIDRYVVVIFDAGEESSAISLINATREVLKKEGL